VNRERKYRDASTGQYTTAADAANRPAETVAETATTRHETPDVAELRALAEDADAGPWGQTDYYDEDDGCVCHLVHSGDADQFRVALGLQEYNAAFIAAANPAAVLGLLDKLDALAALRAAAEAIARAYRARAECAEGLLVDAGYRQGDRDALRVELAHMTEARDNARAERARRALTDTPADDTPRSTE
jgi:hypothetical protein